jgi:probable rRNA maturation factor
MIGHSQDLGEITVVVQSDAWLAAAPEIVERAKLAAEAGLAVAFPAIASPAFPAGVAVVLSDDATVRELNRTWRGQDRATNVLSFPATDLRAGELPAPPLPGLPLELGDVILALETCGREAREQAKPLVAHMQHLVVHGLLHLLGHDHEDDGEALRMEALEIEALATLNVPNPYGEAADHSLGR